MSRQITEQVSSSLMKRFTPRNIKNVLDPSDVLNDAAIKKAANALGLLYETLEEAVSKVLFAGDVAIMRQLETLPIGSFISDADIQGAVIATVTMVALKAALSKLGYEEAEGGMETAKFDDHFYWALIKKLQGRFVPSALEKAFGGPISDDVDFEGEQGKIVTASQQLGIQTDTLKFEMLSLRPPPPPPLPEEEGIQVWLLLLVFASIVIAYAFGFVVLGGDTKLESFTETFIPKLLPSSAAHLLDFVGGIILSVLVLWAGITVVLRVDDKTSRPQSFRGLAILFWVALIVFGVIIGGWSKQYQTLGPGIAVGGVIGISLGVLQTIGTPAFLVTLPDLASPTGDKVRPRFLLAIGFIFLILIIIPIFNTTTSQFVALREANTFPPEIALTMLLIFGIVSLLFVLLIISAAFSALGLSDKKMALGLPEGSVRAVIALTLILVFVILGLFLFQQLGSTDERSYLIREDELVNFGDKYPDAQGNISSIATVEVPGTETEPLETMFEVIVEKQPLTADDRRNFATQLLTALATLVAAISSFYFATRAASTNAPSSSGEDAQPSAQVPVLSGIQPPTIKPKAPTDLTFNGTNLQSVTRVRFMLGEEEKYAMDVNAPQPGSFLVPQVNLEAGTYSIVLVGAANQALPTNFQLLVSKASPTGVAAAG